MREIDAVLFDYGGVLTGPVKHSIASWLAADAIEPESFSRTLRAWLSRTAEDGTPVHRLETGELSVEEFEVLQQRIHPAASRVAMLAEGMDLDAWKKASDDALYAAKDAGRNRVIAASGFHAAPATVPPAVASA